MSMTRNASKLTNWMESAKSMKDCGQGTEKDTVKLETTCARHELVHEKSRRSAETNGAQPYAGPSPYP